MLCGWHLALPKMYRELNLSAIFNILGSASFRTLSINKIVLEYDRVCLN